MCGAGMFGAWGWCGYDVGLVWRIVVGVVRVRPPYHLQAGPLLSSATQPASEQAEDEEPGGGGGGAYVEPNFMSTLKLHQLEAVQVGHYYYRAAIMSVHVDGEAWRWRMRSHAVIQDITEQGQDRQASVVV